MVATALGLVQDLVFRVAKRWIAGKDMQSGLEAARLTNKAGFGVLLNYLGEDVADPSITEKAEREYLALQKAMSEAKIDGSVSVKLTQLGLLSDESLVSDRLEELAASAASFGQQLWIDMESSKITTSTIELYERLLRNHDNVGVALQSYLRRSEADLSRLMDLGGRIRLVKGAYREDPSLVYTSRSEINDSFTRMMHVLFERGRDFTIATHDSSLVKQAQALAGGRRSDFSFAMLRGIRNELKAQLVKEGFRVVDYIPYGEAWYAYSMRRMTEHPSNVWLLFRSLF